MTTQAATDFDNRKVMAAVLSCGVVALVTFLVLPLYVGLLAETFAFSEGQLGVLASMDLAGIAMMSLSAPLWIRRLNWRSVLRFALLWLIAWNYASAMLTGFGALCLARFMAGLGGGLIAVMVFQSISYASNPDRTAAVFVVLQIAVQSSGFVVLPYVIASFGIEGFFGALIFLCLFALCLAPLFPVAGLRDEQHGRGDRGVSTSGESYRPLLVLLGMILFFIAQVSIFSFVERLGMEAGFEAQHIGQALGISAFVGLFGAVAGAVISTRLGRTLPIVVAALVQLFCFALWSPDIHLLQYTLLLSGIQFFWNMPIGYQVGVLVAEDRHHRYVLLVPFVQALGISIGPFLGGFALETTGYTGLTMLASVALFTYLLLMASIAIRQDRALFRRGRAAAA
jgi:predicted MFS family arabinose efflux permease